MGKMEIVQLRNNLPINGILYDGQLYDACILMSALVSRASKRLFIIDDMIDDTILRYFEKIDDKVDKKIYTSSRNIILKHDIALHNTRYFPIKLQFYQKSHDSFLIIDNTVFHVSAPLNNLGNKLCSISLMKAISGDAFIKEINYN